MQFDMDTRTASMMFLRINNVGTRFIASDKVIHLKYLNCIIPSIDISPTKKYKIMSNGLGG